MKNDKPKLSASDEAFVKNFFIALRTTLFTAFVDFIVFCVKVTFVIFLIRFIWRLF